MFNVSWAVYLWMHRHDILAHSIRADHYRSSRKNYGLGYWSFWCWSEFSFFRRRNSLFCKKSFNKKSQQHSCDSHFKSYDKIILLYFLRTSYWGAEFFCVSVWLWRYRKYCPQGPRRWGCFWVQSSAWRTDCTDGYKFSVSDGSHLPGNIPGARSNGQVPYWRAWLHRAYPFWLFLGYPFVWDRMTHRRNWHFSPTSSRRIWFWRDSATKSCPDRRLLRAIRWNRPPNPEFTEQAETAFTGTGRIQNDRCISASAGGASLADLPFRGVAVPSVASSPSRHSAVPQPTKFHKVPVGSERYDLSDSFPEIF